MAFDLNAFLQENRKFLAGSAVGLAVFFAGRAVIDSMFGSTYRQAQADVGAAQRMTKDAVFHRQNLDAARAQQEGLTAAVASLGKRLAFVTRPEFQLKEGGASPANQYLDISATLRERRLGDARSRQIDLVDSVGIPDRAPTQVEEIRRTLRGLDLVDRLLGFALDARVRSIDRVGILPNKSGSRGDSIVRDEIRVELQMLATSQSLSAFLESTQATVPPLTLEGYDSVLATGNTRAASSGENLIQVSMTFTALEVEAQ
ncbi:MAG: hypothetical protein JNJ88_03260 [Planctomycetes bacterium]|nr:hypothetical protein [Planctomycetota bacterium]